MLGLPGQPPGWSRGSDGSQVLLGARPHAGRDGRSRHLHHRPHTRRLLRLLPPPPPSVWQRRQGPVRPSGNCVVLLSLIELDITTLLPVQLNHLVAGRWKLCITTITTSCIATLKLKTKSKFIMPSLMSWSWNV